MSDVSTCPSKAPVLMDYGGLITMVLTITGGLRIGESASVIDDSSLKHHFGLGIHRFSIEIQGQCRMISGFQAAAEFSGRIKLNAYGLFFVRRSVQRLLGLHQPR